MPFNLRRCLIRHNVSDGVLLCIRDGGLCISVVVFAAVFIYFIAGIHSFCFHMFILFLFVFCFCHSLGRLLFLCCALQLPSASFFNSLILSRDDRPRTFGTHCCRKCCHRETCKGFTHTQSFRIAFCRWSTVHSIVQTLHKSCDMTAVEDTHGDFGCTS